MSTLATPICCLRQPLPLALEWAGLVGFLWLAADGETEGGHGQGHYEVQEMLKDTAVGG